MRCVISADEPDGAGDRYPLQPDEPPDTYDEFLARTCGQLLHEPPASLRTARGDSDQWPGIR